MRGRGARDRQHQQQVWLEGLHVDPDADHDVSTTAKQTSKKTRHSYTVKPGDVLSAIAIKTGVPLDTILRLNPNVDAQSLHAGQKLKLAP